MTVRPKEGYVNAWKVPLRFRDFELLNKRLSKNLLYKDKLPSFLRKKLMKNNDATIKERKEIDISTCWVSEIVIAIIAKNTIFSGN